MRIGLLLCLALLSLAACGKVMSKEETILINAFGSYISALTYDEVCNGTDPKTYYDLKQPDNVNLIGNQQVLATRIGGLWHLHHPDKSVDDGVKFLLGAEKKIRDKALADLKKQGCKSEKAQSFAGSLKLYKSVPPPALNGMIDREIEKQHGKVTPPATINTVPVTK